MERNDYLKMLVEEMHSTTMATIGADGHPQTRVIDMMLWDKKGVYFLTAKGKAFYAQLMEQGYVAISATKDKKAVSLRGRIQNIHSEKLDEIFGKIHTCRKFIPAIHARHLRCSACTRPRENTSTSAASRPSSTSTSACTAADARRRVREERFAKEGSSPLILATDFMGIVIR